MILKIVVISILCLLFIGIILYTISKNLVRVVSLIDENNEQQIIPLKSCPFCGKHTADLVDTLIKQPDGETTTGYAIICSKDLGGCGAMASVCSSQLDAISAWNIREND